MVPDHLKSKKMCKNAVQNLPYWYMTQEMCNKAFLKNGGKLKSASHCCTKTVLSSCW